MRRAPKQLTLLNTQDDEPMQPPTQHASKTPRSRTHAAANRECAALILADVARYGGEGSLMAQWARRVGQCS